MAGPAGEPAGQVLGRSRGGLTTKVHPVSKVIPKKRPARPLLER